MSYCNTTGSWAIWHGLIGREATNIVNNYLNTLSNYASNTFESLKNYLLSQDPTLPTIQYNIPTRSFPLDVSVNIEDETNFSDTVNNIISQINTIMQYISSTQLPDAPSVSDLNWDVSGISIPNEPDQPTIQFPQTPTIQDISLGNIPQITLRNDYPSIPESPLFKFPDKPALIDVEIPEPAHINFDDFEDLITEINSRINDYKVTVNQLEGLLQIAYSELKTNLPEKPDLNSIETTISELKEPIYIDRIDADMMSYAQHTIDKAVTDFINKSQRGFTLPPAFTTAMIADLYGTARDKRMDIILDFSKLRLTTESENRRLFFQLWSQLLQYVKDYEMKYVYTLMEVDNFIVKGLSTIAETKRNIVEILLVLLQRVEAYSETIMRYYNLKYDYIKLKLSMNQALVDTYKTEIAAEASKLEAYRTLLEGTRLHTQILTEINNNEKIKIELYEADIRAKSLILQAQQTKVALYEAMMRGEIEKINMYRALLESYRTKIDTSVAVLEAQIKSLLGRADFEKSKLATYASFLEAYTSKLRAYANTISALGSAASPLGDIYRSLIQKAATEGQLKISAQEVAGRLTISSDDTNMRAYESLVRLYTTQASVLTDKMRGIVSSLAQICSASLSAIHVAAQITGSYHNSLSETFSRAKSDSCVQQYIESV